MKITKPNIDQLLEDTLAGVRAEKLEESAVKDATSRVWRRLSAQETASQIGVAPIEHIRGCDDFQALIPSYLDGVLSPARTLLLEDHTHECIPCRKALKEVRAFRKGEAAAVSRPQTTRTRRPLTPVARWAIAATVTLGVGLVVWPYVQRFTRSVGALHTIVQASSGNVFRVSESSTRPLAAGDKIARGERVRAAKGSKAVLKLGDGSQVELGERSEVWLSENGDGSTIHLDRGQIIVEAAKQGSKKHLFVATDDSLVSVTGTIFSVNSGTKGARVSVIEGSVNVTHGGNTSVLRPGDQLATHQSIDQVQVKEEVKWSENREKYSKMLDAVAALRKEIDANVQRPGVRYSTRLLDLAPAGTVIYIAIPNISQMMGDANGIIEAKLQESAELRTWWQKEQAKGNAGFNETISRIREIGSYLGPEVVLCVRKDAAGEISQPIVLAELINSPGLEGYLLSQLNSLPKGDGKAPDIKLIKDGEALPSKDGNDELVIWMKDDLIAASPKGQGIANLAAILKAPEANRFNSSPFHAQLSELYYDGAGLLVAADVEQLMASEFQKSKSNEKAVVDRLGLLNVKYFIAEMKDKDGKASNRAMVTFTEKRGMTSWLAAPGPMGALDFISPDASVVAAFVADRPLSIVDDLLSAMQSADPKAFEDLKKFEAEHGLSLREDFAAPLGGEFAFALDGPMLPIPAWKVVIEVNDPTKFQESIARTVTELNRWAESQGKPGLTLSSEMNGDRAVYTIKMVEHGLSACYTFAYGYFIAAPSKTLVEQAIQHRDAGTSITNSPKFRATLPEDKQANFSAMFFYNFGSAVAPLAKQGIPVPKAPISLDKPLLAYAYALGDRFTLSANTEDGAVALRPSMLAGLPGPFGVKDLIK